MMDDEEKIAATAHIIASAKQQYATSHMVCIASWYGYENPAVGLANIHSDGVYTLSDEQLDEIYEIADACEEWLNKNIAPEGYSFGWYDGEFFLLG